LEADKLTDEVRLGTCCDAVHGTIFRFRHSFDDLALLILAQLREEVELLAHVFCPSSGVFDGLNHRIGRCSKNRGEALQYPCL
jgi:hypothetical protein